MSKTEIKKYEWWVIQTFSTMKHLLIDRNIQIHCIVKHETIESAQKSHKTLIKSGTIVRGIKTKYNGVNSVTKVARYKLFSHLHDELSKMLFYINTNT